MVKNAPNKSNHQKYIGGIFEIGSKNLFFGLKMSLIFLCLLAKYSALKFTILPLPLAFAEFTGLISEKLSVLGKGQYIGYSHLLI